MRLQFYSLGDTASIHSVFVVFRHNGRMFYRGGTESTPMLAIGPGYFRLLKLSIPSPSLEQINESEDPARNGSETARTQLPVTRAHFPVHSDETETNSAMKLVV